MNIFMLWTRLSTLVSCSKLSSFRMIDMFCFNSDKSFLNGKKKENNNKQFFYIHFFFFFMCWIGHLVSCSQWLTFYKTDNRIVVEQSKNPLTIGDIAISLFVESSSVTELLLNCVYCQCRLCAFIDKTSLMAESLPLELGRPFSCVLL